MADDRHERHRPVPGVLGLPRHLLGALSPRNHRIAVAVCAAAVVGLLALVVVLAPRISDTKSRTRAEERVAARELAADQRRRRVREQLPRRAVASGPGRRALRAAVEAAIVSDMARRRARDDSLTRVIDGRCRMLPAARRDATLLYSCTAVTSDIPQVDGSGAGFVGYPYRALGHPDDGRFAFCKVAGRAGEGSLYTRDTVGFPEACGG